MKETNFILKNDSKKQDPTGRFQKVAIETENDYEFGIMDTYNGEFASLITKKEDVIEKRLENIIEKRIKNLKTETTKIIEKNKIENITSEDI